MGNLNHALLIHSQHKNTMAQTKDNKMKKAIKRIETVMKRKLKEVEEQIWINGYLQGRKL